MASAEVTHLQRGGLILKTPKSGLALQFGIPPETIKDCMTLGIPIPGYYVFPKVLFDRQKFVNVAEAEFPAYFNFFIMKKVVTFICTRAQEISMRQVFQETLLGPKDIDVRQEFSESSADDIIPDLPRECSFIRTFHSMDELFKFVHFDEKGVATLESEGVRIVDHGDEFAVLEDGREVGRAPTKVKLPNAVYQNSVLSGSASQPPFEPPLLGVTILGSGHGFDPSHRTSGFVLWINKRGIMVDPPLNSRALLQQNGVPSRLVDSVIVTHCHADHDQGTLQKILEEAQVTLITTSTIMGSFLRKYSALSGLSEDALRRLFVFRPVLFGEPMRLNGGEIRFFYSLHTIPCIGFEVYYGGKSIYFSGDTCYDPDFIKSMHQAGVLRDGRAQWLLNQRWQHNLILHEAGVPPIHTPVSILAALNDDIKSRLFVIHASKKSLPPDSGLKIAPEGVENTMVLNVQPHVHSEAIELLKVIDQIDMFRVFTLAQARELLQNAIPRHYAAGETIIEKDSLGREFFIITAGIVVISDATWSKNFVVGDYFGEMSLVTGSRRSAQAKAKTDVDVVAFGKEDFFTVLRGNTDTINFLLNLSQRRQEPSWQIVSANAVLHWMSNAQKTRLQALLRKRELKAGEYVWRAGQPASQVFLVGGGSFRIDEKAELEPFGSGAFLGEINALLAAGAPDARPCSFSVRALSDGCWGYTMRREQLIEFFDHNPGVKLSFLDTNFIDILHDDDDDLNSMLTGEDELRF